MLRAPDTHSDRHSGRLPSGAMPNDEVDDRKAARAEVDALLRKQNWPRIYAELVKHAMSVAKGNEAAAKDLAQEAIRRVLDANWEPWDPKKHPQVLTFLARIVNRLARNERTSARAHREIAMDREAKERTRARKIALEADKVYEDVSSTEARLGAARLLARRMDRLRANIGGDAVVHALVDEIEKGNETPREQAAATGYSIEEVREGTRRLARHVARVAREIPEGDEE
jgi:hypothetical protein